ncbi:MAG: pyridoxal kinase PdxY [Geminicoccaceae bacterium]|nr:pyridoxal kinase PdxY [Geminicoccaceae bacterium]
MSEAVLSIQSHVAFGHVGNSAAVFALQRLGFEVWPVHTVTLSNHKGYGRWRGIELSPVDVSGIIDGMADVGAFADCRALLSGYLGDPGMGRSVLHALDRLRGQVPQALYLCDPVMGDSDCGFFVDAAIPAFFRDEVVPRADIVTPNRFELGVLTGREPEGLEDMVAAAHEVRRMGPKAVVVTSVEVGERPGKLGTLVVAADECRIVWQDRVPVALSGTGDSFAALFLGHFLRSGSLCEALELAVSAMVDLVRITSEAGSGELLLVEAQDFLVRPSGRLAARRPD